MHDVRLRWKRARPGSERLINVCVWTAFEVPLQCKGFSDQRWLFHRGQCRVDDPVMHAACRW